ncbi:MAG: hypothetical protein HRU28_13710, partial [Rhizobiales bacterium]|nr:hypothetical protein [Hyphomicrobiales bacterium]
LLAGCSHQSTFLVKPGYYQQGRYLKAENVGPYYDSLGHFHPKRTISAHYQPGRWHHAKYRSKDEVQRMRAERDPIEQVKMRILEGKLATEDELKEVDKKIRVIVTESADFAMASPEPAPSELWTDVLIEN